MRRLTLPILILTFEGKEKKKVRTFYRLSFPTSVHAWFGSCCDLYYVDDYISMYVRRRYVIDEQHDTHERETKIMVQYDYESQCGVSTTWPQRIHVMKDQGKNHCFIVDAVVTLLVTTIARKVTEEDTEVTKCTWSEAIKLVLYGDDRFYNAEWQKVYDALIAAGVVKDDDDGLLDAAIERLAEANGVEA